MYEIGRHLNEYTPEASRITFIRNTPIQTIGKSNNFKKSLRAGNPEM